MDMSAIDPLMRGVRQVVKPGSRFVFALCHPCFNNTGTTLSAEASIVNGEYVLTYAVKVASYLHARPRKGVAMVGQRDEL